MVALPNAPKPAPSEALPTDARMKALYDGHAKPLYRFLLRLTLGDRAAAEDLLQETLLRAWRNLDDLATDVETLRPWLYTVARRIAIDAARARPAGAAVGDSRPAPSRDTAVDRSLATQVVREALAALSPEHRSVIIEIYYRGRSATEAAVVLGIPEATVRSRTYYAARSLRAAYGTAGLG